VSRSNSPQDRERRETLLERVSDRLEPLMVLLALVLLGLLAAQYLLTLSPEVNAVIETALFLIWAVFVLQFALELFIAPDKPAYLRRNWLTAVSVAVPPARVFRLVRVVRLLRSARLLRLLGAVNRSLRAIAGTLGRRRFQYVLAATFVIVVASAAGALTFERDVPDSNITTPGQALWWATATVTTMGPQIDPVTLEGRIIALLLRVYAMAVFGYITAAIAAHFVGQDTRERQGIGELAGRLDTIEQHLDRLASNVESRPDR
jgi:voltage-gated potassium channel